MSDLLCFRCVYCPAICSCSLCFCTYAIVFSFSQPMNFPSHSCFIISRSHPVLSSFCFLLQVCTPYTLTICQLPISLYVPSPNFSAAKALIHSRIFLSVLFSFTNTLVHTILSLYFYSSPQTIRVKGIIVLNWLIMYLYSKRINHLHLLRLSLHSNLRVFLEIVSSVLSVWPPRGESYWVLLLVQWRWIIPQPHSKIVNTQTLPICLLKEYS